MDVVADKIGRLDERVGGGRLGSQSCPYDRRYRHPDQNNQGGSIHDSHRNVRRDTIVNVEGITNSSAQFQPV